MIFTKKHGISAVLSLTLFILFLIISPQNITAQTQLIVNPGFETGNFSGWTATNAAGSYENWQVTGSGNGQVFNPPVATQVVEGTRNAWQSIASSANSPYTLTQDVTIPAANTATFYWRHRYQKNLSQFCTGAACGTATFAVEILNTSNVLLQTLYTITTVGSSNTDTGWTINTRNLTPFAGQTIRIRFRTVVTVTLAGPGRLEVDDVRLAVRPLTNSEVRIAGTVRTESGNGISRASVTVTDLSGNTVGNAMTNSFGAFKIAGLEAGNTYTVTIGHKRYQFNPQIVTVNQDIADADFVAIE